MGQYTEGWLTVPGIKDKRWRDSDGNYSELRPGFGSQTMGGAGKAFLNMFRGTKERAFPDTFREEYDNDGSYVKPDRSGGFYGPGGNPSGSGMGQAQQNPGIGPYQGHTPGLPRPSQPSDERTTTNGNGVTQTMKAMSSTSTPIDMKRSFNDLLATTNTSGYQPYSSNQLPATASNPFSGTAPKTQSFDTGAESYTGNSLADFGGDGSEAFASSRETTGNDTFNPNATRIEGGSDRKKGGSLADALNDKAGISSYMSKFSSGDKERAANRAFLDTKGSMEALRAKEAVNGVVFAQNQHYVAGENADSPAIKITRDSASDISNGRAKAQDFLAKKTADTVAATKQAPTVLEDGAKDGAFKQDKPMFTGSTPAIGGAVEFDNNNDKTLPTFGNNGGYKSGFKRIDTTMTNPFG